MTVCAEGKASLFGAIERGEMKLNAAGGAVVEAWKGISERFSGVELDSFVVMPNHFHGVIFILSDGIARNNDAKSNSNDPDEGAASSARTKDRARRPALGKIMRSFKSISAIRINEILGRKGQPVWQRNYFERIVRRGKDLGDVRRYIAENPERWMDDQENGTQK